MNKYVGIFSKDIVESLDRLVDNFTFWNNSNYDGMFYARDETTPDKRFSANNPTSLFYNIKIWKMNCR